MLNDDEPVGRVLTRREALAVLGASGIMVLTGRPTVAQSRIRGGSPGMCVVRAEQTEGPYFVDEKLHRSDIRSDPSNAGAVSAGALLALAFAVGRVVDGRCTPLAGAYVDVWQCDHLGVYSGVRDPRFDTAGRQFLRGYQMTDANGAARFTTVYPGWYQGRAVHIHFKIRSAPTARPGFEFTSQLYFDEALTDQVHAREPYAAKGQRNVRNERDGIFRRQGGQGLILNVTPQGEGYAGTFDVAVA
ncbi:MAG: intradiol ring-cleavage dioxygenase [Gemmatimonadaceae bacterium]